MTRYLYDVSGYLVGTCDAWDDRPSSTLLVPPATTAEQRARFVGGQWNVEELATAFYPTVGPIHFKMLFTAQERLKAKELRASDEMLNDFWELVEDPRTDVVNLGLQSVQQAVEYTLSVVTVAGVVVDVPARKAAILSGVLQ